MRVPAILQRKRKAGPLEKSVKRVGIERPSLKTPTLILAGKHNLQSVLASLGKERRVILVKPLAGGPQPSSVPILPSKPKNQPAAALTPAEPSSEAAGEKPRDPGVDPLSTSFPCDSCDECFDDRPALIIHKTERSIVRTRAALREPVMKFGCDMCKRLFSTEGAFLRHYRNCGVLELDSLPTSCRKQRRRPRQPAQQPPAGRDGESGVEPPAACDKCNKVFKRLKYLRVHKSMAHGEHLVCQVCELRLDSVAELKSHMSAEHSSDHSEFCTLCGKGFYLRQSLKVHLAAHARDDKPCVCERCGKSFRHEVYLRKHVQTVHVEMRERKRYQCDECGYETHYKTCFREHMYKHTGEDQVECEVCSKHMRRGYLKIHARIHTGEKPEICEYCGKSFSARKYLTRHLVTHTGEKPYPCQLCGKRYTQRGTLTMHFRKHHPQETAATRKQLAAAKEREERESERVEGLPLEISDIGAVVEIDRVVEGEVCIEDQFEEVTFEEGIFKEISPAAEDEEEVLEEGEIIDENKVLKEEGEITNEEVELVLQEDEHFETRIVENFQGEEEFEIKEIDTLQAEEAIENLQEREEMGIEELKKESIRKTKL